MPAQVTNYQCPGCTGPLHFVGASGKLECEYCGASYDVAEIEALYAEKEEKAAAAQQAAEEKALEEEARPRMEAHWDTSGFQRRLGCGGRRTCGRTAAPAAARSSSAMRARRQPPAPIAATPPVVPGQFSGQLKPDFIIPFKLSREDAIKALREHYKGKILLPKTFTNENHVQEIRGVYVPFWMFDGKADGRRPLRGYPLPQLYRSGDYEITKTEHFDIYRAGSVTFEKVPVDASSKMPDDHMDSIEPYDYKELEKLFHSLPSRLSCRQVRCDAWTRAAQRADQRCEGTLEAALRGTREGLRYLHPSDRQHGIWRGARYITPSCPCGCSIPSGRERTSSLP